MDYLYIYIFLLRSEGKAIRKWGKREGSGKKGHYEKRKRNKNL